MSKSKLKKGFAAVMAISVIVWTFALAVSVNVTKGAAYDIVKAVGDSKLYLVGSDGSTTHYIPDASIFYMYYTGFGAVTVNETDLSGFTAGNNLSIPAGVLVKAKEGADHPEVYLAVKSDTKIVLRHVKDMDAFNKFGLQSKNLFRVPYSILSAYDVGDELTQDSVVADVREMNVVKYAGAADVYLIEAGVKKHIASETAYRENYFGSFARVITIADTETYTDGDAIAGPVDTYKPTIRPTVDAPVVTGGLTVSLAADTPASSTLVAGQSIADLAHFTFTASEEKDLKVTKIKMQRIGISADATLTAVYLYDGTNRLSDLSTVSSTYITINDSTGLFTVPAGESKTVAVKSNILSTATGETVGVQIVAAADVTTASSATVSGTFPVKGNLHSIATATLATVALATTTLPAENTSVQPGETEFQVWKTTATIGSRDVTLNYLRLREIGSIDRTDLQNFKLFVAGVQVGETIAEMSSDLYVTFDLTASPVVMKSGGRDIEVKADIINGSSKNYTFSLRQAADIVVVDSQYGVNITATRTTNGFPATCGTQTVSTGSLTINKAIDSPSSNVVKSASNVTLGVYTFTAYGEDIKVETLRATFTGSRAAASELRNGAIYADGVQVGSTADLNEDSHATTVYTEYTLGSSLIVSPNKPVTVEIKADVYDGDGTDDLVANDTILVKIVGGDLNNGQAQTSLTILDLPASGTVDANSVTVVTGSLSGDKDYSYGNQTIIAGLNAYKIADYVLSAAEGEDINISTFTVGVTMTDLVTTLSTNTAANTLSNVYLKYGDITTTPKSTASTSNAFSVSYKMTNNSQIAVEVYANVTNAIDATDNFITTLAVTGTTKDSGTAATLAATNGQTITVGSGSVTEAVDGTTPVTGIAVAGSSNVKVATFKFTTANAPVTMKDITIKLSTAASDRSIQYAKLDVNNDGTADTPAVSFQRVSDVPYASFTGLNFEIPKDTAQKVSVMLTLNEVKGNGVGTSGDDVKVNLYSYKKSIAGAESTTTPTANSLNGSSIYVRNTLPTVTKLSSSGAVYNGTEMDIYQFKIAADSKDDVAVKQLKFAVTVTDNTATANTLTLGSFKLYRGSTNISANVDIMMASTTNIETGGSSVAEGSETVVVQWSTEEVIQKGTSSTYTLKATPSGFTAATDDDNFTIQMSGDAAAATATHVYLVDTDTTTSEKIAALGLVDASASTAANFIWSDNSKTTHSSTLVDNTGAAYTATSTTDWINGYLLETDVPGAAVQFVY